MAREKTEQQRQFKERMEGIRKERADMSLRLKQLEDDEAEIVLEEAMDVIDPLCINIGITLPRLVDLLYREARNRGLSAEDAVCTETKDGGKILQWSE